MVLPPHVFTGANDSMEHALPLHLLRRVPIVRVLALRGIRLTRRGARLTTACPIHGGDNPGAFVVHPERNLWYCFSGCGRGGDVIDLVRRLDRCSHRDAVRHLATVAEDGTVVALGPPPLELCAAWRPYTCILPLNPDDDWLRHKGIRAEVARSFGVGRYDGRGFLSGCIGVHLHDDAGRPLGYAGRRLYAAEVAQYGKWKLPPGLPKARLLYGLHRIRATLHEGRLVLVECPWGVLRLAQLGVPAVALLGTTLTEHHHALLQSARSLALLFDGDPPGRQAGERAAQQLAASGTDVVTLHLPDGLDPDDLSDHELHALLHP